MDTNYKKGDIVKGTVSGLTEYGIFVKINDEYDGLVHISSISDRFVRNIGDYASLNDIINVEILDIDEEKRKMKLSIKNIKYKDKTIVGRINETEHGFKTLKTQLPIWIEKNLKSVKKD